MLRSRDGRARNKMADLSQLSDEQLGVYRDLLAKQQPAAPVPGTEKLGGQPPAAGTMPPPPKALQGPPMSVGQRALHNLPLSIARLPERMNPLAHGGFSMGPGTAADSFPGLQTGPQQPIDLLGDIKRPVQGLVDLVRHPGEAFANDPAGTIARAGLAAQGGLRAANAIPRFGRTATNFETVMSKAKDVPLDLTDPGNIDLRAQEFAGRGATLPKVLRHFTNPATNP